MTATAATTPTLLVIGIGLIGTSVALAARQAGYTVYLDDVDDDRVRIAEQLGAGIRWPVGHPAVDLAVVAVSPRAIGAVATDLLRRGIAASVSHVGSTQLHPQLQVEASGEHMDRYVGSHPIAGSEHVGPAHASPDLFRNRPWVICPAPATEPATTTAVEALAIACGADPVTMPAAEHDALFARLSHLPQLVASALAASLTDLEAGTATLAGGGLRDTTRIAASDPRLWTEIIGTNPAPVAAALRLVLEPLQRLHAQLATEEPDPAHIDHAVHELIDAGRRGRSLIAGKHGDRHTSWAPVAVVVPDAPGALARLLADAASSGANVEDIHVDHVPGHPQGVVELAVATEAQAVMQQALVDRGWTITSGPATRTDR